MAIKVYRPTSPGRRQASSQDFGMIKGTKQGWKKAIVQVAEGQEIPIFAGAQV